MLIVSLGGLYHVVIKNGLTLFLIISIVKISNVINIQIMSKTEIYCISNVKTNTAPKSISILRNPVVAMYCYHLRCNTVVHSALINCKNVNFIITSVLKVERFMLRNCV